MVNYQNPRATVLRLVPVQYSNYYMSNKILPTRLHLQTRTRAGATYKVVSPVSYLNPLLKSSIRDVDLDELHRKVTSVCVAIDSTHPNAPRAHIDTWSLLTRFSF